MPPLSSVGKIRSNRPWRQVTIGTVAAMRAGGLVPAAQQARDRKSTRLNSSHLVISYAVFCLKEKTHSVLRFLLLSALSSHCPSRSLRDLAPLLPRPTPTAPPARSRLTISWPAMRAAPPLCRL